MSARNVRCPTQDYSLELLAMPLSFAVIICTYRSNGLNDLELAVKSIREQVYDGPVTIVICVDGNEELYHTLLLRYAQGVKVVSTGKATPSGLARARNLAISYCTEDVISFLDDDAIADRNWISNIAGSLVRHNCVIAAGKTLPLWGVPPPDWLPPAFYWLIGATGVVEQDYEHFVRSGYGSNIGCRRDALFKVGMFDPAFGMRGHSILQGEEADLGLRIQDAYGEQTVYNPKVIIFHKVDREKLQLTRMLKRAYYQGKSKALLFNTHGRDRSTLRAESDFLRLVSYQPIEFLKDVLGGARMLTCLARWLFTISVSSTVLLGFIINISAGRSRESVR